MSTSLPNCCYRVSIVALILNDTRNKFLIAKEASGQWGIPGGGLDWNEDPRTALRRELLEEMGLRATWIAEHPAYFTSGKMRHDKLHWATNIVYETTLEHFDFTPSEECVAIDWIGKDNADEFKTFLNVPALLAQFDPARHQI